MPTRRSLLASVSRSSRVSSSKRGRPSREARASSAANLQRAVVLRQVHLRAPRDVGERRQMRAGEGLEVDVGRDEDRVGDAVAPLQRLGVLVRVRVAQLHQRLGEQRRAAAERDHVEAPRLAALGDERDQPRDVGHEGARARAVEEVVPHPRARRPGEGDHGRVAPEEVRPAAHQHHHLVEGRAVAGHVDHHRAGRARSRPGGRSPRRTRRSASLPGAPRTPNSSTATTRAGRGASGRLVRSDSTRSSKDQPGSPSCTCATPRRTASPARRV